MTPRLAYPAIIAIVGLLSASAHAATIQVIMEKLGYTPADVQAKVGDTIEWVNKDILVHTATARNGDWDVRIEPHKTSRLTLKKAGTVDYYCRFHPNMKARLTVAP
jgi:plastocyanin